MSNPFDLIDVRLSKIESLLLDIKQGDLAGPKKTPASQDQPKQEPFITAKEAAEYLGVSPITLHGWKSKGIVPSHRINTRIRYKISELDAAMKSRKS